MVEGAIKRNSDYDAQRAVEDAITKIRLSSEEYLDKMHGCWLGKNIGGTLGTPYEGRKYAHCLNYYDPVPNKPLPNDDRQEIDDRSGIAVQST